MRVIAAIVLVTFAASAGCSARYVPVNPQPRDDPSACEDLVGNRVDLQLSDSTFVTVSVVACEYPYLRGHAPQSIHQKAAHVDTLSYDLREVLVVSRRDEMTTAGVGVIAGLAVLTVAAILWALTNLETTGGTGGDML